MVFEDFKYAWFVYFYFFKYLLIKHVTPEVYFKLYLNQSST